jgi:hypothetical protein
MVRQIELPPDACALSTLPRVDYTDAFLVDAPQAGERTAEEWARAIVEGSPAGLRRTLRMSWRALGLKLGPAQSEERVLGWQVHRSQPDHVILASRSIVGFSAELLLTREPRRLLFATLVQLKNPVARAIWAAITRGHQRTVRYVLEQGMVRLNTRRACA